MIVTYGVSGSIDVVTNLKAADARMLTEVVSCAPVENHRTLLKDSSDGRKFLTSC